MKKEYTPLKNSFVLTALFGFIISVLMLWRWSLKWSFALSVFFLLMIIASLISARHACPDGQLNLKHKH